MHIRLFAGTPQRGTVQAEREGVQLALAQAQEFCTKVIETGGDARLRSVEVNDRTRGYEVYYCSHSAQWVIEGLPAPLDFLLTLLAEVHDAKLRVRIQYVRARMLEYSRDEQNSAIDEGSKLGLIVCHYEHGEFRSLQLTKLARDLEGLASQTH